MSTYQEFPRVLYRSSVDDILVVNSKAEKLAALKAGYTLLPPGWAGAPGEDDDTKATAANTVSSVTVDTPLFYNRAKNERSRHH